MHGGFAIIAVDHGASRNCNKAAMRPVDNWTFAFWYILQSKMYQSAKVHYLGFPTFKYAASRT
ncbi:MAG: hypothetical protein EOO35_00405 [Cyanobacteriota bacterium]|nr:MAG: hypothetical protein EOO35_00405 [Cyanobacteriota bacterium]